MEKGGADILEVKHLPCLIVCLFHSPPRLLPRVQLGVPFSDPMADGTTIQAANTTALEFNVSYGGVYMFRKTMVASWFVNAAVCFLDCLNYVREARKRGLKAPVILMGYAAAFRTATHLSLSDLSAGYVRYVNPLIQYGEEKAVKDAKDAGIGRCGSRVMIQA